MNDSLPRGAVEARLRDDSVVLMRRVEPTDKDLIRAGFDRLGAESRYRRFLSPMPELTQHMLRYLTEVDHHDHEAVIAIDPDSGQGVGIARFIRTSRPDVAEVAVTVVDDWQGRGLGTRLLELLAARAREEGISRFTALVLATNADIIDLLGRLGSMQVVGHDGPSVQLEAELPPAGLPPAFKALLRESADVRSPLGPSGTIVPAVHAP